MCYGGPYTFNCIKIIAQSSTLTVTKVRQRKAVVRGRCATQATRIVDSWEAATEAHNLLIPVLFYFILFY